MALLTGAITALTLAGTPGIPQTFADKEDGAVARTYSSDFTRLSPNGGAGRVYGSFTGKAGSTSDAKFVTDTYVAVLTFDAVDAVDLEVSDAYVVRLGMSAFAGIGASVSDTYVPRVTLAVGSLQKSSITLTASVTDSYVPALTMSAAVTYNANVTDSYVPVLTFSTPTVQAVPIVEVSDDYVPVLGMEYSLDTVIGAVRYDLVDVYIPALTMNAGAATAGEVDMIHIYERPYGLIRIVET